VVRNSSVTGTLVSTNAQVVQLFGSTIAGSVTVTGTRRDVTFAGNRSLGAVTLKYQINGGPVQSAPTSEWTGGERFHPAHVYYHEMRGVVTGTSPGDSVKVWFEGGGQASDSFTYQAVSETGRRVLVVAAEDYSGASPAQTPGPHYLQYYLDALAANGVAADVYDVDARGRIAPDHLGVLSHYDGVIWYTGDDIVTRRAGWGAGNADRLALDEMLEFRAYMNEGGNALYTGPFAAQQYVAAGAAGQQFYDPKGEAVCRPVNPAMDPRQCLLLRGSTLYVVQNRLNTVLVLSLRGDTARLVGQITDPRFDVPTTVGFFAGRLYLPNARFTTPPTPETTYTVNAVPAG